MKRAVVAFLLAIGIACGEITPPPAPEAPLNRCSTSADCEAWNQPGTVCVDGACTVAAAFNGAFVISLPLTSFYAPGQTIVISSAFLADLLKQKIPASCTDKDTRPACSCKPKQCLFLPPNGALEGTLETQRDVAVLVWPSTDCQLLSQSQRDKQCGLRPRVPNEPTTITTVPSRVVFRPLWSTDASGKSFVDAQAVGLPLPDVEARVYARNDGLLPPGPNNSDPMRYSAVLQQTAVYGNSRWTLRFDPTPPFDGAFPPVIGSVAVTGTVGATGFQAVNMTTLDQSTFELTSVGLSLEGWKVYLASDGTAAPDGTPLRLGERVSSIATLSASGGKVNLQTDYWDTFLTKRTNFAGLRLIAEPPAGAPFPTYESDELGGFIPSVHVIPPCPDPNTCPTLPPPVSVRGTVQIAGKGRAARVWFDSQRGNGTGIQLTDGSFPSALSYDVMVETDADGAYSVVLPPGIYDAHVEPVARDVAKTTLPFSVSAGPPVQQGKTLALEPLVHVHGSAMLADGRPVTGARVTFVPAVVQPQGTNPHALPRPFTARTVLSGGIATFDADVDPGVYDITLQPADGSKVPWVVSTTHVIKAPGAWLDPFVVPAPSRVSLTLYDPFGNPIVNAQVRAYQTSSLPPMGMAVAPFYEVGRSTTDSSGHFDLYLASQPR
jgi:hypothetical protein